VAAVSLILPVTRQTENDLQLPAAIISMSFPFEGVIAGHFAVFRGLARRRGIARETPENPKSLSGGPNGICYLVGQYLRFPFEGTAT
jgi:hypothetical protein